MLRMTDPTDGLISFQDALSNGAITLLRGDVDPELFVHMDSPAGNPRFSYVRLDGAEVTAFVTFVPSERFEGAPCFQIGYAVPEKFRNEGRAQEAVQAAIAEMQHGFARTQIATFYVEAIVGADNVASQHVAEKTISSSPTLVTDSVSKNPALQYMRRVERPTAR